MSHDLLLIGVVLGPHGLQGALRVKFFFETPEEIRSYSEFYDKTFHKYEVKEVFGKKEKDVFIVKFKGIESRNASEPLKGLHLYLTKDTLTPLETNQFYHADLLGVTVKSSSGEIIGTVESVQNYGAGDLLEIKLKATRHLVLVPFTSWAVPLVDLKASELVVDDKVLQDLTDTKQPDRASQEISDDGY